MPSAAELGEDQPRRELDDIELECAAAQEHMRLLLAAVGTAKRGPPLSGGLALPPPILERRSVKLQGAATEGGRAMAVVPGYPKLHPLELDFWEKFWRIYGQARRVEAGSIKRPGF